MPPRCTVGSTFILRGHLWVIVAILPGPPERAVTVNITTKRQGSDLTVTLKSGDHDFIKHDTVVNYSDARTFAKTDLIDRIEKRLFEQRNPFDQEILGAIQEGLFASPFTPKNIKNSCTGVIGKLAATVTSTKPASTQIPNESN